MAPATLDPRFVSGADYGNPDPAPAWMGVDWRAHTHSVALPGAGVNYVEIGEGEPVLFIHGISGTWQNWLENLPYFGAGRRAIALDLPGFGASPMPEWEIGMASYGQMVHDFCEALGLEGVDPGRQLDGRLHRGRGGDRRAAALPPPGPGRGGRDHEHLEPGGAGDRHRILLEQIRRCRRRQRPLDRQPPAQPPARPGAVLPLSRASCAASSCWSSSPEDAARASATPCRA